MRITNANVFMDGAFHRASVTVERGIIVSIGAADSSGDLDAKGMYLLPGFVDIRTHGAMNEDFSDGKPEGLQKVSRYYAHHGVTSFLATTRIQKEEKLRHVMEVIGQFVRPADGAKCAGIHIEGPFPPCTKWDTEKIQNLDIEAFQRLNEASGHKIRFVTVAPELDDALSFIREISKKCTVSVGRTTGDYETAMAAFEAGASHAAHLFDGMPGLAYRSPSAVGAALDSNATVELVCDGVHVHPAVIYAVHRIFGKKLVVVSDSMCCTGLPDGRYEVSGQPIEMKQGRVVRSGPDTLTGSFTNLLEELRNLVYYGIPLEDAVTALTTAPARAAGLESVGVIAPGKSGDLLLMNKELELKAVFIDGERISI